MTRTAFLVALCALVLSGVNCSKSSDNKHKSQAATTGPAPSAPAVEGAPAAGPPKLVAAAPTELGTGKPAAPAQPAGPRQETEEYVLEVQAPTEIAAGAPTKVSVVVRPKGHWHFNVDFPTSLSVEVQGGSVDKAKQSLSDATSKSEEQGATWTLMVTPDPGAAEVVCNLKFAVCTDSTCDPKKATVAWKAAVK